MPPSGLGTDPQPLISPWIFRDLLSLGKYNFFLSALCDLCKGPRLYQQTLSTRPPKIQNDNQVLNSNMKRAYEDAANDGEVVPRNGSKLSEKVAKKAKKVTD